MVNPHGSAVNRSMLARSLDCYEAIRLMPAMPPRCSDVELLRAWEAAMRAWINGPLWLSLRRKESGFHDRNHDQAHQVAQRSRGDRQEPGALAHLPAAAAARLRRGPGRGVRAAAATAAPLLDGQPAPDWLTLAEVCALAGVGRATVNKAVFRTRHPHPLDLVAAKWWLPRAVGVAEGFALADVLAWIEARHEITRAAACPPELGVGVAGSGLPHSPGSAITGGGIYHAPSGRARAERRPA